MKVDLLIVGASFAGLACAQKAAQAGLSVVVLEKKQAPGDKLHTTGILVKEAFEQMPCFQEAPPAIFHRVDRVRLYAPDMRALDLQAPGYYFVATDTPELLNWMAENCRAQGVSVLCATLFETAFRVNDGSWRVPVVTKGPHKQHEQHEITARYLIGADGPNSRVARALQLSVNTEFLYGVEKEYPQVDLDKNYLHCFLDQGLAAGYIGWALTTKAYAQVGLARRLPSQKNGSHPAGGMQFDKYIEKISPVVQIKSDPMAVRAGMIPCGGTLKHIACPQAMLVGDAAGTVSPVTAGGIRTALMYGEQAGVAVADYLHGKVEDPALWLVKNYPCYRVKRVLRGCYDRWQSDWIFNQLFAVPLFRRFAEQVYFHRKGKATGK